MKIYYITFFAFVIGFILTGIVDQKLSPVKIQIHFDKESKYKSGGKKNSADKNKFNIPETKAPQKLI